MTTETDKPTREQRNECRNAILDTWSTADYRELFDHTNVFHLIRAMDAVIDVTWAEALRARADLDRAGDCPS